MKPANKNKFIELLYRNRHILFCCIIYSLLCIFTYLITNRGVFIFLIWNLFLAMLPLLFAEIYKICYDKKKLIRILFLLCWFFFFPNAPYFVTDLIHITRQNMNTITGLNNLHLWISLFNVFIGAFLSILSGFLTIDIILDSLLDKKEKLKIFGVIFISLISGYAIYIGRFPRLNSWDILRPVRLIQILIKDLDIFVLQYSCIVGIFILFCYYIYYSFLKVKNSKN